MTEVTEHDIYGKWDALYDDDAPAINKRALEIARDAVKEMQAAHDALDLYRGEERVIWMYIERHERWGPTVVYPY